MPSVELLFSFLVATAVFAYMPGPSTLYAAAQTIALGRRAGWLAALGIHIGGYVHVIAAALGISVLFSVIPLLFSVMKIVGAVYLIYLGIQLFRSHDNLTVLATDEQTQQRARQPFWQSIIVEVLNPKTAIFYIAFLPQFCDPAASLPMWAQLLTLGTVVNIMFSSADVLCVMLSSKVMNFFKHTASGSRIVQRLGGAVLVGLGINLAFTRQ